MRHVGLELVRRHRIGAGVAPVMQQVEEMRMASRDLLRQLPQVAERAVDEHGTQITVEQHKALVDFLERGAQGKRFTVRRLGSGARGTFGAERTRFAQVQQPDRQRDRHADHRKDHEAHEITGRKVEQPVRRGEIDGAEQHRNRGAGKARTETAIIGREHHRPEEQRARDRRGGDVPIERQDREADRGRRKRSDGIAHRDAREREHATIWHAQR